MTDTWLIAGAHSAIARAFAHECASHGDDVILLGRDPKELERSCADLQVRYGIHVHAMQADFLSQKVYPDIISLVEQATRGNLHCFIGFATMPPEIELRAFLEAVHDLVRINFIAPMQLIQSLLPILEQQKQASILVLSSVAGDRARKKNYYYAASKAGLSTYLEGLSAQLADTPITVTTIKPGYIDTAMTYGRVESKLMIDPKACARACWRAYEEKQRIIYIPKFWRWIMGVIKLLPHQLLRRLPI